MNFVLCCDSRYLTEESKKLNKKLTVEEGGHRKLVKMCTERIQYTLESIGKSLVIRVPILMIYDQISISSNNIIHFFSRGSKAK